MFLLGDVCHFFQRLLGDFWFLFRVRRWSKIERLALAVPGFHFQHLTRNRIVNLLRFTDGQLLHVGSISWQQVVDRSPLLFCARRCSWDPFSDGMRVPHDRKARHPTIPSRMIEKHTF
jgi:hypothetical protein